MTEQGGAQTLGKRKAYQKRPMISSTTQSGPDYINQLIRNQLGYDLNNLYKNEQEEEEMKALDDLKREEVLQKRYDECKFEQGKLQAQQRGSQQRKMESSDKESEGSSDEFSSSSSDEDYERKRTQKQQHKNLQKQEKASSSEEGSYSERSESEDDIVAIEKTTTDKGRGRGVREATKSKKEQVEEVTFDDFKKIVLLRANLESWCGHIYFKDTVINAFVKYAQQQGYKLAQIINVKEIENQSYSVGNKKTNFLLQVKYDVDKTRWIKMILVSNKPLEQDEFEQFIQSKKIPVTMNLVRQKIADIKKAQQFSYNPEQIEEMVSKNLEKRIKSGKLNGVNLSYLKVEFQNQQAQIGRDIKATTDPKRRKELIETKNQIDTTMKLIEQSIVEQMEKDKPNLEKASLGMKNITSIEELEKKKQEMEWLEWQEQMKLNPEKKKNTIFMQLRRDESVTEDSETQKSKLQQELILHRLRSQKSQQELKDETYFERMERLKKEFQSYHQNLKLLMDSQFKKDETNGEINFEYQPIDRLKTSNPHPDWVRALSNKIQENVEEQAIKNVKVISFEEYFN